MHALWQAAAHHHLVYIARLRRLQDKKRVCALFSETFGIDPLPPENFVGMSANHIQLGAVVLERPRKSTGHTVTHNAKPLSLLPCMLEPLAVLAKCVEMKWMAIVTGGM